MRAPDCLQIEKIYLCNAGNPRGHPEGGGETPSARVEAGMPPIEICKKLTNTMAAQRAGKMPLAATDVEEVLMSVLQRGAGSQGSSNAG